LGALKSETGKGETELQDWKTRDWKTRERIGYRKPIKPKEPTHPDVNLRRMTADDSGSKANQRQWN